MGSKKRKGSTKAAGSASAAAAPLTHSEPNAAPTLAPRHQEHEHQEHLEPFGPVQPQDAELPKPGTQKAANKKKKKKNPTLSVVDTAAADGQHAPLPAQAQTPGASNANKPNSAPPRAPSGTLAHNVQADSTNQQAADAPLHKAGPHHKRVKGSKRRAVAWMALGAAVALLAMLLLRPAPKVRKCNACHCFSVFHAVPCTFLVLVYSSVTGSGLIC